MDSDTGLAFIATAELLRIDKDDLLNELMGSYVASVQKSIIATAEKFPSFSSQYPFIAHNSSDT